jgi:hypothetical protein
MPHDTAAQHPRAGRQTVLWIIALLLTVIATALWLRPAGTLTRPAYAQTPPLAGARGVYAFTGPIERDKYGLFMLDVDQGTIWCYAFDRAGETAKLRLVAARTWIYDRYLQDFNCAEPSFRMVRELVSEQRNPAEADPDAPRNDADRNETAPGRSSRPR